MSEHMADNSASETQTSAQTTQSANEATGSVAAATEHARSFDTAPRPGVREESQIGTDETSRTKAFSQRLKEMSERKADEIRKEYEGHDKLLEVLQQSGYDGDAEQIAEAILADRSNLSESEEDGARSQYRSMQDRDHPALQWAQEIIDDRTFESDLNAIKNIYPELEKNNVWELGDIYLRLMLSGEVDAVTAYEAQLAHDNRNRFKAPPSVGSAGAGGLKPEKEFYTPEEVDRLSKADYDNPKIMSRVRKSMTKWR